MNIALRHPERFTHVLALSGRYDLTKRFPTSPDLMEGYYDDDVYFNTPSHFMVNLTDPLLLEQLRRLEITIVIGETDPFLDNNRNLSQILWDRGVRHGFHVWPGYGHGSRDWREMVTRYLNGTLNQRLNRSECHAMDTDALWNDVTVSVSTVQQFMDAIAPLAPDAGAQSGQYWYRGQTNAAWGLNL